MSWLRVGECPPERCGGKCCNHVGILYSDAPEIVPFLHLLQVRGISVKSNGHNFLADIPQRCQYLTETGLCSLHPAMNPSAALPRRPDLCGEWPTEPWHLTLDPQCGFSFEWKDERVGVST